MVASPLSETTQVSSKRLVGAITAPPCTVTTMPSRLSQKSMASSVGSKSTSSALRSTGSSSSEMIRSGIWRPPAPTTIAAGRSLPEDRISMVGPLSWVSARFPVEAPPAMYSSTVPVTSAASPTATEGAPPV